MALKEVFAPHLNRTVKMGRTRPAVRMPRLKLSNYLLRKLPSPPTSIDYTSAASAVLSKVYLNDQLGDCVIAAGYHLEGVLTGNAGSPFLATDAQITADYSAIGGYVPGDSSTDQGCDEQTALAYWASHGFASGNKLAGSIAVDATNEQECMTALWLFENLYMGVELPDAWISPFPSASGFTWDVASGGTDPNNGHAIGGFAGADASGVTISTWGLLGLLTWKALSSYMVPGVHGELYTCIGPEMIIAAMGKAPNGFDWSQLIADFDSLGGTIPQPAPPGPVPPTPAPPAPSPPTPQPSFQERVDSVFAAVIAQQQNRIMRLWIKTVQTLVDNYIKAHPQYRLSPFAGIKLQPIVDAVFASLETQSNIVFAPILKLVQYEIDLYLSSHNM